MIGKRPRIIDVTSKPQKCPVCGERVVDIIYGTGDMTEVDYLLEYRKEGMKPKLMKMVEEELRSMRR